MFPRSIFKITPRNSKGESTAQSFFTDDVTTAEKNLFQGNEVLAVDIANLPWKRLVLHIEARKYPFGLGKLAKSSSPVPSPRDGHGPDSPR